jgi:hypothetical protein
MALNTSNYSAMKEIIDNYMKKTAEDEAGKQTNLKFMNKAGVSTIPISNKNKKVLSILICSLEKRKKQLNSLLKEINKQIFLCNADAVVELLVEVDNKEITTGKKRNNLLKKASGKYICFIDDDDKIYENYLKLILKSIESDADCIATSGTYSVDGGTFINWHLSKDFNDEDKMIYVDKNGNPLEDCIKHINCRGCDWCSSLRDKSIFEAVYLRRANHLTPVKRELALKAMFPNISNGEDREYSKKLNPFLKSEVTIEEKIYHYEYISYNKEYK